MKLVRGMFAYGLGGFYVQLAWALVASQYGIFAGFVGALIAIAPTWYVLHYKSLIPTDQSWFAVDMGLGVASTVFFRGLLSFGSTEAIHALSTFVPLVIGACLGGIVAFLIERLREKNGY